MHRPGSADVAPGGLDVAGEEVAGSQTGEVGALLWRARRTQARDLSSKQLFSDCSCLPGASHYLSIVGHVVRNVAQQMPAGDLAEILLVLTAHMGLGLNIWIVKAPAYRGRGVAGAAGMMHELPDIEKHAAILPQLHQIDKWRSAFADVTISDADTAVRKRQGNGRPGGSSGSIPGTSSCAS